MSELFVNGLGNVNEELWGALEAMPRAKRMAALRAVTQKMVIPQADNSRTEFEKQAHKLEPAMITELQSARGGKKLADVCMYVTKCLTPGGVAQNNIKMLKDDDTKVVGVGNISGGKLEKGNVLLVNRIVLLTGVGAGYVNPYDVDFGIIAAPYRNGQFYFRANDNDVIPPTSLEVFNTANMQCRLGEYKLDNPVLLNTQKAMEFFVEWAGTTVANTWMRAMFFGSMVVNR